MDKRFNSDWNKEQKKQWYYEHNSKTLTTKELDNPSLYQNEDIDIQMTFEDMTVDEFIATTRDWIQQQLKQIKE